ncbi:BQ2448_1671 [Microbotryum intermedium]|uniref:Succinate-semialdehyde dehydrogenase, mitochondrial n=1 Tax=Microbotryum intermedium TaxID=269621 RepID=A0A238FAT1_9BASI|nr:BQ2448_1671 [Microbotryum intermedium]
MMLRRSLTITAKQAIKARTLPLAASSSRMPLVGLVGRVAPNCGPTSQRVQMGARFASTSSTSSGAPKIKDTGLWKTSGLINGKWTSGTATKAFTVMNPGTGKEIGTLPDMGLEDTKQAIDRAYEAFETWGKTSEYERSKILTKIFQLTNEASEDLAQILTAENGKPLADARGEISYGGSFWEWYAGEAVRSYGDIIPSSVPGVQNTVIKQPVGVCGIITPWNFPNAMITRKVGAALAAGCTVVIKAPSETPYSILAIAEIAKRAGIPDGVINVILTHESTSAVGKELCENHNVHKVSFTGSTRVGKILMKQSSDSLKKLSMELGTSEQAIRGGSRNLSDELVPFLTGGNAPLIVFDDADLDKAVAGTIVSKFRLSGQTCVCANRILVQDGVYDEFAAKLADAVRKFKVGEGTDEGITHGPLIHENAVKKVKSHVENAKSKGAKVVVGGDMLDLPGYFFQPTVLTDVQRCAIDEDETFGPLAALYRFKTEAEAIQRANEPDVGLAAYIFTENIARLHRVSAALETGMVGANTGAISQAGIPFGGVKQSGFGREGSKYGLSEYQIIKFIAIGGLN